MFLTVDDPDDPRVADFRNLNDGAFRCRVEAAGPFGGGFFVAEGWLALEAALVAGHELRSILVAEPRVERLRELLGERETTVLVATPTLIEEVVGFDLHRGVVASVTRRRAAEAAAVAARASRLVVVEGINDGENLGSIFRNVAALGAGAVLLDPTTPDPLSRRVVRVSLGHVLRVPWARVATPWRLADHRVLALTPSRDALPLDEVHVDPEERIALLVGAEGPGLSDEALAAADVRVSIPMAPGVDSLNVATALAIALWHLRRTPHPHHPPNPPQL